VATSAVRDNGGIFPLLLLCMAQFVLILDVAIVNVALPLVQEDLGFAPADLQLVVTAYALFFGGLLLLGGRAADLFGRRRVFVWGLGAFTLASLLCGLAPTAGVLVAARALQGAGAALVAPAGLSLLTTIFPEGEARNRALGAWSAVAAGAGAAGLILGSVLTELVGWRSVFLINAPVGIAVVVASLRALPGGRPEYRRGGLDLPGAAAATLGLIALVYALSRGEREGFGDGTTVALLLGSAGLLAAFVIAELRARDPLVPFGIFRSRTLAGANLATLLFSAVVIEANYFPTLHLQQVLSFSPLRTGLAFLPMTTGAALASALAARYVAKVGTRRLLLWGMLSLAAGSLLLCSVSADGGYLMGVLPGMVLIAVGMGLGFTIGTVAATAGVRVERQGAASGILTTGQQLGGAVGLAVLATVAAAATEPAASPEALVGGFRAAFLAMCGFGLLATAAVWALVREPDCRSELERRSKGKGNPAVARISTGRGRQDPSRGGQKETEPRREGS
jgi:EmrB/QacA subfamily drug resistance transporter